MAIVNTATFKTLPMWGSDALTQHLIVIHNGPASRVDMILRRLVLQVDNLAALTTVMPIIKVARVSSFSGGLLMDEGNLDSTQTPDPNIKIYAQAFETAMITATPEAATVWQQYASRATTIAEQLLSDDYSLLSVVASSKNFILHPGEALVATIRSSTVAAAALSANSWFCQGLWEEDSLSTFAISGTVTLSATPVSGAIVTIMEGDDESMTNARFIERIVTGGGGTWNSTIRVGKVGAAFVQYKDGGTYYTAPGSPYLQQ